jgi:hypothetical protein
MISGDNGAQWHPVQVAVRQEGCGKKPLESLFPLRASRLAVFSVRAELRVE